ncbi:hypothetical protein EYF80_019483 [Liparis tanakae]|uniref:Uncharacterized protein n=1 Tax=Liparis tanakae TaxID=230148 RepID=A0A4Z2HWS2_9TELE|nr:hypothetical protein EYF80_019483 [Liparis tanakae]
MSAASMAAAAAMFEQNCCVYLIGSSRESEMKVPRFFTVGLNFGGQRRLRLGGLQKGRFDDIDGYHTCDVGAVESERPPLVPEQGILYHSPFTLQFE